MLSERPQCSKMTCGYCVGGCIYFHGSVYSMGALPGLKSYFHKIIFIHFLKIKVLNTKV